MLRFAWRNLLHERVRMLVSTGGVALSVLLIFFMSGVFAGSEEHAVAYMKNQPAELWLMQAGVENLHMSSSLLPTDAAARVRQVDGVGQATGLLYAAGALALGEEPAYSYLFAVDEDAPFGQAWAMAAGSPSPGPSELVIDVALARRYGLEIGDTVTVLGRDLTIAGLSKETFGIATSISWVNKAALSSLIGVPTGADSYILVQLEPDADKEAVAHALQEAVPEANVLTREAFIASDQEMIRQMGADIIRAMTIVAYVVGLLVVGLTIYTATVERAREYAVLKALGAQSGQLMRAVFAQALLSSVLGFGAGVILAIVAAGLVGRLLPEMLVLVRPEEVARQAPVILAVTALAALLPLSRVLRLDPMVVFRT
jgi:putative ABC transport system permease protein